MVGKVLTGNGITTYLDGHDSLLGSDELSDAERDELLELCRQRFGEGQGAHAGSGRCECCWAE